MHFIFIVQLGYLISVLFEMSSSSKIDLDDMLGRGNSMTTRNGIAN